MKVGVSVMARSLRPYHMSPAEGSVMNVFWNSKASLSQAQILQMTDGTRDCKKRSIFAIVNGLLERGLIQVDGYVRSGKTYARTFSPAMSRPEYYARMVAYALSEKELIAFRRALRAEIKKLTTQMHRSFDVNYSN